MKSIASIYKTLLKKLWEPGPHGRIEGLFLGFLRLFYAAIKALWDTQISLMATSLVYTTLLSLVPFLAVSFSVLKAFGVHNMIEPLLAGFLAPLGERGELITSRILDYINRINIRVLGGIGLAILLYNIISLVQKIETSVNYIWKTKQTRSFARRFSDYLSIILVGPVLIFAALGITSSLMSHTIAQKILSIKALGGLIYVLGKLVPYFFVSAAFTFIYVFLPNTKVRFRSALAGGVVAGILWQSAGWAFATFTVSSAKYPAIYSGLAIIILFMLWLNLNWRILLVGAEVAFQSQYPQLPIARGRPLPLSGRLKEKMALVLMFLIARDFYEGKSRWTKDALVKYLGTPMESVQYVLEILERKGLAAKSLDNKMAYKPARALDTILVRDILHAARTAEEDIYPFDTMPATEVDKVFEEITACLSKVPGEKTIKDLIVPEGQPH